MRTKIWDANKKAEQLNTPILRQFLSEYGHELSKWRLLRILHHLGYYFGQGEHRDILHESPNNVAYRCRYLRFRFANLEGNNDVPRRPEVFLDESYCHLHHTSRNTWVPHQGVVLAPGHGPLVVIFGAIIVFRNGSSSLSLILFIFGIQQLNLQEAVDEKGTMLKNGMIFPMLLKMPILFLIKLITMGTLMQKFLRTFS